VSGPAAGDAMRLSCELAWLGGEAAEADVLIEVSGDRISAVTAGVDPPDDAYRVTGLILPGLANAHSHAFQRALRGRTHTGEGSFWTWREQMYELAGALDPDACFELSRAAFGEMALAGITCVGEFHYLHHAPDGTPYEDPNAMGRAVLAAARAAGLRITLLDACYLHGGLERFRDRDAAAWVERVDAIA
jgi:cytosine/adenosine deaminase-related metal-dependent hydrolase